MRLLGIDVKLPRIRLHGGLLRLHIILKAYLTKYFRTRYMVQQWQLAHAYELTQTPVVMMPMVMARQSAEIEAVRQGRAGSGVTAATPGITDRKSWQWPYLPASINRLSVPILKAVPYNLRRMSRTPVPRRAMNQIKGAMISLPWEIEAVPDVNVDDPEEQKDRIRIATKCFKHPNNDDSFQSFIEQGLEDHLCLGAFVAEMALTPDPERPIKIWPVNLESVRVFVSWTEATVDLPRYAQMTGMKGERGAILFFDDELLYLKDNQATDNPFGLGKMEIAFSSINALLGVQDMAGRAGADQVHKCFPAGTEVLTRRGWIQWPEARDDDEFATRSIDGQLQWQRALGFVREQHDGDLIQFRNREFRMTVTPHHRVYGQCIYKDWKRNRRVAEDVGFVQAHDLFDAVTKRPGKGWRGAGRKKLALADFRVPTRTEWKDGYLPSSKFKIGGKCFRWEDWAAFLGIWVAEGSCLGAGLRVEQMAASADTAAVIPFRPPNGEYRIQIAQSREANPAKYARIARLLKRMGIAAVCKADRFIFSDRDIWSYLIELGDSFTKYVPQWVKDAPVDVIRIFFDWAMMGDGTVGPRGKRIYYTSSERLAGDMQELFQKIGSSAAVTPCKRDSMYAVAEMLRETISIVPDVGRGKDRTPQRIPYSGMVYCAMVPNGTLYCREQGYAFWSGNTWLWWEAPQTEAAYQIVRRHIQNELEGQAKISIIGGMKKPEVIDVQSVKEEDILLTWQEMLIRMIANAFDMSAMSLGIEHDVNRAVGQVLNDRDFRTAVVPVAKRIEEGFTRKILHNKLQWYDLQFKFLGVDDPDIETRVDMFSRMYSMNAITPNQIRKGLNLPMLENPYADLTQFECMLLNIEAMGMQAVLQQDQMADHSMQRQAAMQQQMPPQPQVPPPAGGKKPPAKQLPAGRPQVQPGQQKQSSIGEKLTPSTVSRGGQPPSMKPLSLPKFPIPGAKLSAAKIAQLPLNQMQDVFYSSGWRASGFLKAMDEQEPGILQTLSDQVKEFLEHRLQEEIADKKVRPIPPKLLKQWQKDLAVRIRQNSRRSQTYEQYMYRKRDVDIGTPGRRTSGKPGRILPPINRGL